VRIAYLTLMHEPRFAGGIGSYIHTVANSLSERGHEVWVFSTSRSAAEDANYHFISVDGDSDNKRRRLNASERFLKCVSVIHNQRPFDIIESTDWGLEGYACARAGHLPLIVRLHTPESLVRSLNGYSRWSDSDAVIAVESEYLHRAGWLSSPSRALARHIIQTFGVEPTRLSVIPNPIAIRHRFARISDLSPRAAFRFLFLGRLEKRKGVDILMRAFAILMKSGTNASLDLVGSDTRTSEGSVGLECRQYIASYSKHTRFLGFLTSSEVANCLTQCDAVVLPSYWENFSYACLEALSAGRPVIATSGSGFEEMIRPGHNGILTPPGDPEALASAMMQIISTREQFDEAAIEGSVEQFSCFHIVPWLEQSYREISSILAQ